MSVPRYPAYRDSGVAWFGEMPAHWEVGPYKRFVDIQNGADHKHIGADEGYPVIGSGGHFAFASDYMFDGESVLLGRKGTIDRPLFVSGRFWVVDTMYWTKVAANADARFAYYTALTIPFGLYSTNTALPSMTKSALSAHRVAIPPLAEQRAIAAFLDRETAKIDALVAEQRRLMDLLSEQRQAVISHAVTKGLSPNAPMKDSGVEWLGEIPAHWSVAALARIASRVVVGIAEAATHAYTTEGVPILRSTNVRANRIVGELLHILPDFARERGSKLLAAGDLVTVRTGNAGVTAVVPPELDGCQCFTMLVTSLREGFVGEYVCHWLNSAPAQAYFSLEGWGTAQVNISVPILKAVPVPLPPIQEQRAVLTYLNGKLLQIDALVQEVEHSMDLLAARRTALITAAVTGQIDVRGLALSEAA